MSTQTEVHQQSLFSDPISRLYELQMALKIDKNMREEMEKAYPADLAQLIEAWRNVGKQVKEAKGKFKLDLFADEDYAKLVTRIESLKEEVADESQRLRVMIAAECEVSGQLDLTVDIKGTPVRLQTMNSVDIFLNGKALK